MANQAVQSASQGHSVLEHRKYFFWVVGAVAGSAIAYSFYNSSFNRHWVDANSHHGVRADSAASWPKRNKDEATKNENSDTPKDNDEKNDVEVEGSSYLPDWSGIGDRIKDAVVPEWAQELPGYIARLQKQLSDAPDSLANSLWREAQNPQIHPEIEREAQVRVSDELCDEEQAFIRKRKEQVRKGLSKYLQIPEANIHPDDVPVIGTCGSGGGLRAMVAGSSSYLSAQEAGLFDCVTYTAGVSGSCWLQSLYHSTLTNQSFDNLLNHLKSRISTHIAFPPSVLKLITNAPTHKYLLAGAIEKHKGVKNAEFGIVDIYGLLLGARLMVPKGELDVDPRNLKLSHQRKYVDNGEHPLPIYTAVRHEVSSEETIKDGKQPEDVTERSKKEAWFEWFEFTPYELWCEEFASGIPTWSVGREFDAGRSQYGPENKYLPEMRIPLLQGIWGSAFCATLAHYLKEVRPIVEGLPGLEGFDKLVKEYNEDLVRVHPVDPSQIPNYVTGMREQLPKRCPESTHDSKQIQLMDAGMSNNLPIYPLLRPGRNVDIVVAFDASADIKKDNWLRVTDGYARQRGIKGWPVGIGWPKDTNVGPEKTGQEVSEASQASTKVASDKLEQAKTQAGSEQQSEGKTEKAKKNPNDEKSSRTEQAKKTLGYCTVWVGSKEERTSDSEPPQSKAVEDGWALMQPHAGIAVIYFPFMANPDVEGVDPEKSDFLSTWNFIYTPENIDKVVELARANFKAGEQKTKMAIRAIYERKRNERLERDQEKD